MSLVSAQEVPIMQPMDWAIVAIGLGIGISSIFFILSISVSKSERHRVYTWTNFWLVLSGVIHVRKYLQYPTTHLHLFVVTIRISCPTLRYGLSSIWFSSEIHRQSNLQWICMQQPVYTINYSFPSCKYCHD